MPGPAIAIEDAQSFKADGKPPLYAARNRVYPKDLEGICRRFKRMILFDDGGDDNAPGPR